jgi:uncharacterized protein (TIGR02145 family)
MKNRISFLKPELIFLSVIFFFTNGCNKENDDNHLILPTVATLEIKDKTDTTALSGGEITDDGGQSVIARGVCWSTSENPTVDDNKTEDGTGTGVFTSSITALEPNTKYYARAYAISHAGTAYGNTLSFTTYETGYGSFTDPRDDNVYKTVTIGNQIWMAENLKYLPKVVPSATGSETIPYYYVFNYEYIYVAEAKETGAYDTYGVLYNWPAALTACPAGWRLPGHDDWFELTDYLDDNTGGKLKATGTLLTGTGLWSAPNRGATNETGFSGLPAGFRTSTQGFANMNASANWWSATETSWGGAWYRIVYYNGSYLIDMGESKNHGMSVRCLKD